MNHGANMSQSGGQNASNMHKMSQRGAKGAPTCEKKREKGMPQNMLKFNAKNGAGTGLNGLGLAECAWPVQVISQRLSLISLTSL